LRERPFDASAVVYPRLVAVTSTGVTSRKARRASLGRPGTASPAAPAIPNLCPYLIAEDGAWRSARPARDHRCGAVDPPAPLALDKQRRLCLTRAHGGCATRLAALDRAPAEPGRDAQTGSRASGRVGPAGATRWSIVRTAPVVLDASGGGVLGAGRRRLLGQWGLGALMALALGGLIIARLPGPSAGEPSNRPAVLAATGGPPAAALAARSTATARPSTPPTPSPVSGAPVSVLAGPAVASKPSPSATGTHLVRPGDTLIGIARAYDTSVEELQEANGLGDSTVIRIGQELVLP
jgi:LysM repeat protein